MGIILLAGVIGVGCGASSRALDCPDGEHAANPDDRGNRCVDDRSSCDRPSACVAPADPCCASACADSLGTGVYACVESCGAPDCTPGSCGPDLVCLEGPAACQARCVPDDLECPEGTTPADPSATGAFVCAREDSECLAPGDCAAVPIDPCCWMSCADSGDARYVCSEVCQGGAGVACMCTTDADCVRDFGAGYTCSMGGGCLGGCSCDLTNPSCQCEAAPHEVCGVDGTTYDSACGDECVPVEIACDGACPCPDCACGIDESVPVCGTDGQTYDAACDDRCVPVEIACRGACPCDGCDCAVGAYVPVCGADGQTYDAACGDRCVPVEIACRGECPCAG